MYDDQLLIILGAIIYIGVPAIVIATIFYFIGKRSKK